MGAQSFENRVYAADIRSLRATLVNEELTDPIIRLGSDDQLEVSFDLMSHSPKYYSYSIVHCNADWTPSVLSSLEYMSGFQNLSIDDFANSLNTTTFYTNYRLFLPNNDIKFKVSGNYVVKVYNEDRPKDIVFTACFSIVEPKVNVADRLLLLPLL